MLSQSGAPKAPNTKSLFCQPVGRGARAARASKGASLGHVILA